MEKDERFMGLALEEARKALKKHEVPIGAVLVIDNRVIARDHNQVEGTQDPTAHAEILVIRRAAANLNTWRLTDGALYVTVEPCCMCLGAIMLARIKRVVFGIKEPKTGFFGSQANLHETVFANHGLAVDSGILADEALCLMQGFFQKLRRGTEVWP